MTVLSKQIDRLVQDCSNSIANALELLQFCTKPSKLSPLGYQLCMVVAKWLLCWEWQIDLWHVWQGTVFVSSKYYSWVQNIIIVHNLMNYLYCLLNCGKIDKKRCENDKQIPKHIHIWRCITWFVHNLLVSFTSPDNAMCFNVASWYANSSSLHFFVSKQNRILNKQSSQIVGDFRDSGVDAKPLQWNE